MPRTISCHDCGPMLESRISETKEDRKETASAIAYAAALILAGKIIALKGVGGYNFVCSPFDEKAVKDLRRLKIRRREKPFAVMFRDLAPIKEYCHVSPEDEELIQSNAKPIVLLERKKAIDIDIEKKGDL